MDDNQKFCLRWSSYQQQLSQALWNLLHQELLVDVTLACDGRSIRAHRAVLSACSSYFQDLFMESIHPHPIVILKDVKFEELEALVQFMYHGEVNVSQQDLPGFLKTAETLKIRGLASNEQSVGERTEPDRIQGSDLNSVLDTDSTNGDAKRGEGLLVKRRKQEHITESDIPSLQSRTNEASHQVDAPKNEATLDQDTACVLKNMKTDEESFPTSDREHRRIASRTPSLDGISQLIPGLQDDSGPSNTLMFGSGGGQIQGKPIRQRVLWNQDQLLQLETWYRQDRYPTGQRMKEYADMLGKMFPFGACPSRQNVDYWFQNRRRKDCHPEVVQQREKKKLARVLWGHLLDQKAQSSPLV